MPDWENFPTAHEMHAASLVCPATGEYFPSAHGRQIAGKVPFT